MLSDKGVGVAERLAFAHFIAQFLLDVRCFVYQLFVDKKSCLTVWHFAKMINTGKLAGKTIFITGASRGIGKAIALKAAKDGANIVIAAKTSEPHPKLPGTIHSAAEEIKQAGGKCLACQVDIRDEAQVQNAVEQAVKEFGGIDIVVNNASAISLTGTLDTPMKRYDLMHQVNTRGTYLVSQKCIPYLKQAKNPHILNLSPPLRMHPLWFQNHVAYTMAKYGMSMCVLGMAGELKPFNISVNALWPRTAIWTAAMGMLAGDTGRKGSRNVDIMADAAYVILTKDARSETGNFYIDEEVLKKAGVKNFDKYAEIPGEPLMLDFFTEEAEKNFEKTIPTSQEALASKKSSGGASAGGAGVESIFEKLKSLINPELVGQIKGVYLFNLTGASTGSWFLDLKNGNGSCGKGEPSAGPADVTMTCETDKFVQMFTGKLKPTAAFMSGQLKIKGNMGLAMKLEKLMSDMKSKM